MIPPEQHAEIRRLFYAEHWRVGTIASTLGVHPDTALRRANRKFESRFRRLEALARERGIDLEGSTLEALDRLWDEIKSGDSA